MAAGRLSCRARKGRGPGEESRPAAVAAQAIEAQPSSGQIKPKRGRGSRAEQLLGRRLGQPDGSSARRPACRAKRQRSDRRKRTATPPPNRSSSKHLARTLSARLRDASSKCSWRAAFASRIETSVRRPRSSPISSTREPKKRQRTWPCSRPSAGEQALPVPRPSNGGANSASREKAVQPETTAPITENAPCHTLSGMPRLANANDT